MSRNFELLNRASQPADSLQMPVTQYDPITKPHSSLSRRPLPIDVEDRSSDWLRVLRTLHTHWRWSALFAAIVLMTTIGVTFLMRPVYEPIAKIEVDPPGAELFSMEAASKLPADAEYLETQAQNLQSDELAVAVIRELHLDTNSDLVPTPPPVVAAGTLQSGIQPASNPSGNLLRLSAAEEAALATFKLRLNVQRDTSSHLIAISFASHDPQLAANVTNTLVRLFVDKTYRTRHEAIMRSTEWLTRQLDDVRQRMEESNRALAKFQSASSIANVDENRNTLSEQLVELSRQRTMAQAERIQLGSVITQVKGSGGPASLLQVQSNPVVQELTKQLGTARAQLSQSRVIYGKNHPEVKKLENQTAELENQINLINSEVLRGLKTSYAAAHRREQLMAGEMKGASKDLHQVAEYDALRKESQANAELYNDLYRRIKESGITAASKSSNIRMVDQARVLINPTRPNILVNLLAGLAAALFGAVLIPFIREGLDNRLRTPEDVRKWTGLSSISILPAIEFKQSHLLAPGEKRLALLPGKNGSDKLPEKFLLNRPHSAEAEALRGLHTSIMFSNGGRSPQILLVVSPFPGEGKTTVAVNLAIAMAQHGSTCILDADLRKSRVATVFGLSAKMGLSEVVTGLATVEEVLWKVPDVPNLSVLPASTGCANPGEIICSDKMRELLHSLRQQFRCIVVDSPPILPFADGRALSPLADGVILVGRSGSTTREALVRSIELLTEVHSASILQMTINDASAATADYKYYHYGYQSERAS